MEELNEIISGWIDANLDYIQNLHYITLEEDLCRIAMIDLFDTHAILFVPYEGEITKDNIQFMPFVDEEACEEYAEELMSDNGVYL